MNLTRSLLRRCPAAGAMGLLAAVLPAQVSWTKLSPTNSPSPRLRAGLAYDRARDQLVLFGGQDMSQQVSLGDTWLFDGSIWKQANPRVAPSDRTAMAMAYDSRRQRTVLFGGWSGPQILSHNDTWEWDGTDWKQISPSSSPSPRSYVSLAYDSDRGRMVMFGGRLAALKYSDETWEWDGTNWHLMQPTRRPRAMGHARLCYDTKHKKTILTSGYFHDGRRGAFRSETWEWDGVDWTRLTPANEPEGRYDESLAYDEARDRIVRYRGGIQATDPGFVYEWTGGNWVQRNVTAQITPHRHGMNAVYDSRRGRFVGFGGYQAILGGGGPYDETWSYGPVTPAKASGFGAGCAGSTGVPVLRSGLPWLGETVSMELSGLPASAPTWFILGLSDQSSTLGPLPASLAPIGMPGCSLHVSIDLQLAVPSQGGSATLPAPIPLDPTLVGLRYFVQGAVVDPGANSLGVVMSPAVAATIGGK